MVWNYSIFDHSLPCKQLWQTEPAFLLLLGDVTVEFMSPLHSVSLSLSLWYSDFFFFFTASFQHSCLLFIMKATVESFRFACSCGYPTSHKHGNFLPRFPLLNQVEAWHPSQLWPLNALMLQLCLLLLTTHSSERAFLLLHPEQPPLLSASSEPASTLLRIAEQRLLFEK